MPQLLPPPETALARFFLIFAGVPVPVRPTGSPRLSRQPGESPGGGASAEAGPFYFRDQLTGELSFTGGEAYRLLTELDQSADRCQSVGLLLETRPHVESPAWAVAWRGTFTCQECSWDYDRCAVSVKPVADDAYRRLLEAFDVEHNLLMPELGTGGVPRRSLTATLATLAGGTFVEWLRCDATEEADKVGVDGWAVFLRSTSYIDGTYNLVGIPRGDSTRDRTVLLFRYRLVAQPLLLVQGSNPAQYVVLNRDAQGWSVLPGSEVGSGSSGTVDYVKSPTIAGFKIYKITNYGNWNDPLNPGSNPLYDDQLLLLPCYQTPADYGRNNAEYLKVTGIVTVGQSRGGAYNAEADNGPGTGGYCLNVRRNVTQGRSTTPTQEGSPANSKSLWWRFGDFEFGRCFPLLSGIHWLLKQTIYGPPTLPGYPAAPAPSAALLALLPPSAALLSDFFSNAVNPVTGATGAANELPGLLLSAASDVKRYGASEPATRVLISLKTLLSDVCALYDCGWFIDPATGWLRIEHRSYVVARQGTGAVVDLRPRLAGTVAQQLYAPQLDPLSPDSLTLTDWLVGNGASVTAGQVVANLLQGTNGIQLLSPVGGTLRHDAPAGTIFAGTDTSVFGAALSNTPAFASVLPRAFSYRSQQLPRYEELTIASAETEVPALGVAWGKAAIRYGGACVNARQGQNRTTASVGRLTGDVTALVLGGQAVPDNAVALLAADAAGHLANANRAVAASELLLTYHVHGRAQATGADVNGRLLTVRSTRPQREQTGLRLPLASLTPLAPEARLTTSLGPNGQLATAELDLLTGLVSATVYLPAPSGGPAFVAPLGQQFDNSFNESGG